jgi:hypothetical protein
MGVPIMTNLVIFFRFEDAEEFRKHISPETQAFFPKRLQYILFGFVSLVITGVSWFISKCFPVSIDVTISQPELTSLL